MRARLIPAAMAAVLLLVSACSGAQQPEAPATSSTPSATETARTMQFETSGGTIANADTGNTRVQAWDKSGKSLWAFGSSGSGPGEFSTPIDVAFGPNGTLVVVDDIRVQVFDADHQVVGEWSSDTGDHFGAVAVDGDTLWVEALYPDKLFELRVAWPS